MSEHARREKHLGILSVSVASCLMIGLVLALAIVVSGCGSRTPQTAGATGAPTTVPIGAVGPAPLESLPYIVVAQGRLSQTQVEILAGGAVIFRNGEDDTSTQHHLVADDGSFDTGVLDPGAEYVIRFPKGGTFAFHDASNPAIRGSVVVTATVTAPEQGLLAPTGPIVGIKGGRLTVTDIHVRVGEAVTFANTEDDKTTQHHLVADDGSFDTGVLRPDQQFSFTFQQAGTYAFHDVTNPSTKGTITVK